MHPLGLSTDTLHETDKGSFITQRETFSTKLGYYFSLHFVTSRYILTLRAIVINVSTPLSEEEEEEESV